MAGVAVGIAGFTGRVQASTYPYFLIGASLVAALGCSWTDERFGDKDTQNAFVPLVETGVDEEVEA